jgi:hypothetical protein
MKTFSAVKRPALWAALLACVMVAGLLTVFSGCDIGGCNCDDDMDELIATRGQPDSFDIVDATSNSIYTLIYIDKLTDEQIAAGVQAYRYEYKFQWGDDLDDCCVKTATKTLVSESGTDTDTDTETGTDTGTGTDTDTDTGTDTGSDSGTGTDTEAGTVTTTG